MTTQFTYEACSRCGSAKLKFNDKYEFKCLDCGLEGDMRDVMESTIKIDANSVLLGPDPQLEVVKRVAQSYFHSIAKYGSNGIGLALLDSGIVGRQDKAALTRLIKAACFGAYKATLNEIEKIQAEIAEVKKHGTSN